MVGSRLGAYEIVALIGAGGMGEVYKARDTRLDRLVAIKVLPPGLAANRDHHERLEREARAISQLNHPHICTLYDIGTEADTQAADGAITYLVMEYLEGDTLDVRLANGALPLDQALRIAIDVAEALDAAHAHGILHRDLKPANVMLTTSGPGSASAPQAKLLDFGLAKLQPPQPPISGFSAMPTGLAPKPLTAQGTILGTLQYMSPEQLEGLDTDARTDIFAFGALVYEMVTGRKAFPGKSQPSVISAIMSADPPPVSSVQAMSPPALDHLVKVCLAKDPADRWRSIHDVLAQLKWIAAGGSHGGAPAPAGAGRRSRERILTMALVAAVALAAVLAVPVARSVRPAAPAQAVTFEIQSNGSVNLLQLAVSPDGRQVAYLDRTLSGGVAIFVRALDSPAARQIAGSDGASGPFWSPDSRQLGFSLAGSLRRVPLEGGSAQVITSEGSGEASWSSDDTVLFSPSVGLLRAVPASGGSVRTVLDGDGAAFPSFIPGARDFLYFARTAGRPGIYAASLDSPQPHLVLPVVSHAVYTAPGQLLFMQQGTIFAQPFNPRSLQVTGKATAVASGVYLNAATARGAFAASQNGVLIYRTGTQAGRRQFVWRDRDGRTLQAVGKPDAYTFDFDLSPDGTQVALSKWAGEASAENDLYVMDWTRDAATRRVTFDKQAATFGSGPVWAPDGTDLAYAKTTGTGGGRDIFRKSAIGLGDEAPLLELPDNQAVEDWSANNEYLAYMSVTPSAGIADIWVMPLSGNRTPIAIDRSAFAKDEPHFSPDGKWLAYNTTESGTAQIQLVSLPLKDRIVVTTEGGVQPRWRADGRELFYLALDGTLMAVDMSTPSNPGRPRKLFATGITVLFNVDQYDVHPDGKRFLILQSLSEAVGAPITVVVNWKAP